MNLHALASPARFSLLNAALRPWLAVATLLLLGTGSYMGLLASPPDYQQGESVRIMYVHVPAAWTALSGYAFMAVNSLMFLVWKHALADRLARHSAPVVMVMALLTLVSGALWGRPTWGTYWVWDARLTSMLILFLIVSGYHVLARQSDDAPGRQQICAWLCLLGAVNLPVIKFSVEWWNTLHQPASLLRAGGVAIAPEMLWPLLLMAGGFLCFFFLILSLRIEAALVQARAGRLRRRLMQARRSEP